MSVDKNQHRIIRRLQGKLPEQEAEDLDQWLQNPEHSAIEEGLKGIWSMSGSYKADYQPDTEKGLARFKAQMAETPTPLAKRYEMKTRTNWLSRAASIALLIGFLGLVAYILFKPSQVEMMAVTTAIGEKKELNLSDGSKVILNENSKLVFPADFNKGRQVRLSGEAFFEIAKDPEHPFSITCPNAFVEVLGTAFNLRAYPEESFAEVEVEHGKVRLSDFNHKQPIVLESKQLGVITSEESTSQHTVHSEDVPTLNAQAWRTHILDFRTVPMEKVLDQLERYYGVRIDFADDSILQNCSFVSRYDQELLQNVFKDIERVFNAKVEEKSPNHYVIRGGNCRKG